MISKRKICAGIGSLLLGSSMVQVLSLQATSIDQSTAISIQDTINIDTNKESAEAIDKRKKYLQIINTVFQGTNTKNSEVKIEDKQEEVITSIGETSAKSTETKDMGTKDKEINESSKIESTTIVTGSIPSVSVSENTVPMGNPKETSYLTEKENQETIETQGTTIVENEEVVVDVTEEITQTVTKETELIEVSQENEIQETEDSITQVETVIESIITTQCTTVNGGIVQDDEEKEKEVQATIDSLMEDNKKSTAEKKLDIYEMLYQATFVDGYDSEKALIGYIKAYTEMEVEDINKQKEIEKQKEGEKRKAEEKIKNKIKKNIKENLKNTYKSIDSSNYKAIQIYLNNMVDEEVFSDKEKEDLLAEIQEEVDKRKLNDYSEEYLNKYKYISNPDYVTYYHGINSDLKGWIYIEGTGIDYPILQSPYGENNFYLQHNWQGYNSSCGAIELDYRYWLGGMNTILYGHHLANGTMFTPLANYKSENYWKEHKLIEITNETEQKLYEIFACCSIYGMQNGTQFMYWGDYYVDMTEDKYNEYLNLIHSTEMYSTGVNVTYGDELLTMQTCDGDVGWRTVVFAKRIK